MIPNIFAMLNVAAVNAFVGSRIYGAGHAGDDPEYPYVTWQILSGQPQKYLGEVPDIDNARVQINVFARSEQSARETATAVRDVMDTEGYQVLLIGPEHDPVTKSTRIQMDYSVWTER